MTKVMLEGIAFDPEVEKVHQAGVAAAVRGDIVLAGEYYTGARRILHQEAQQPTASDRLQAATIRRDQGFLGTHALVAGFLESANHTSIGRGELEESRGVTTILLREKDRFTEGAKKRIHAEHGATISCQARVLVYSCLANNQPPDQTAEQIRTLFGEARDALRQGDNAYYGASNAMRAAAFERTIGGGAVRGWLADAVGFASTPYGMRDFANACRTVGSIGMVLPSKAATKKALLKRP
jgi:hypothetical protein